MRIYSQDFQMLISDQTTIAQLLHSCHFNSDDFPLWNVWDNWKFDKPSDFQSLQYLFDLLSTNGRLIIGFYDHPIEKNTQRIENLKSHSYNPSGQLKNSPLPETICWFDE